MHFLSSIFSYSTNRQQEDSTTQPPTDKKDKLERVDTKINEVGKSLSTTLHITQKSELDRSVNQIDPREKNNWASWVYVTKTGDNLLQINMPDITTQKYRLDVWELIEMFTLQLETPWKRIHTMCRNAEAAINANLGEIAANILQQMRRASEEPGLLPNQQLEWKIASLEVEKIIDPESYRSSFEAIWHDINKLEPDEKRDTMISLMWVDPLKVYDMANNSFIRLMALERLVKEDPILAVTLFREIKDTLNDHFSRFYADIFLLDAACILAKKKGEMALEAAENIKSPYKEGLISAIRAKDASEIDDTVIHSFVENLSGCEDHRIRSFIRLLINKGALNQAHHLAKKISDPLVRAVALFMIFKSQDDKTYVTLEELLSVAEEAKTSKGVIYEGIVEVIGTKFPELAFNIISEKIEDPYYRALALKNLHLENGEIDQHKIAKVIEDIIIAVNNIKNIEIKVNVLRILFQTSIPRGISFGHLFKRETT